MQRSCDDDHNDACLKKMNVHFTCQGIEAQLLLGWMHEWVCKTVLSYVCQEGIFISIVMISSTTRTFFFLGLDNTRSFTGNRGPFLKLGNLFKKLGMYLLASKPIWYLWDMYGGSGTFLRIQELI